MLQPSVMNSDASQSSSSGCVGASPCVPKSFSVRTIPRPKNRCQTRLTVTLGVSGLLSSTSHRARSSRFGLATPSGANTLGVPGCTWIPLFKNSPCSNTCVGRGWGKSRMISVLGMSGSSLVTAAIAFRRSSTPMSCPSIRSSRTRAGPSNAAPVAFSRFSERRPGTGRSDPL